MIRAATPRHRYAAFFFLALLALLAASCGSSDQTPRTEPPGSDDELLLRVEQGGGFVPVESIFTSVPGFSLYGDGRVIYAGPVPEIFPGPALPNLLQVQLSDEGVEQLLAAAEEAGLDQDGLDLGEPPIADAPTSVFTLNTGNGRRVVQAYALGYEQDLAPQEPPSGSTEAPGMAVFQLTEEQREARRRLIDFQAKLFDLPSWLGEAVGPEQPYEYRVLEVISQPADPASKDPSGLERGVQEWPLGDLATLGEPEPRGRRFQVTGEDLQTLVPQVREANTLTLWKSGEAFYTLYLRPLLPDERTGPAAPAG